MDVKNSPVPGAPLASGTLASPNPGLAKNPKNDSPSENYPLLGIGLLLGFVLAVVIAFWVPPGDGEEMTRKVFFRSRAWRFAQTLLFTLALLGAVWRSASAHEGPDAVVLTFVIVAFLVAVTPLVEKISFPGSGSVDLGGQVKSDVEALQQYSLRVQMALAAAGRIVTQSLADITVVSRGNNPDTKAIFLHLTAATEGVSAFLRPPQPASSDSNASVNSEPAVDSEMIRVSAWTKADSGKYLIFAAGWPQEMCSSLVSVYMQTNDQSPAAITFATSEVLNYSSVSADLRPLPPPTPNKPFNGLLILPLRAGGETVGVLLVERTRAERFEPTSVAVAKQLAALYAGALA